MPNYIKELFQFWKPTVSRKITLYFTIFGLLVFYLTTVVYLIGAKKHMIRSVTRVVSCAGWSLGHESAPWSSSRLPAQRRA